MNPKYRFVRWISILVLSICVLHVPGNSYSVLTHEEIVDLLWKDQIVPLLKQRFPNATSDDLRDAHAYAYGGSLVQDMGYYPFGNKYFSDLVHYVRSGDFVQALLQESSNLNEYSFALGALAHYASDVCGHPSINHAVSIEFPKLGAKFGQVVTYADDPKAHIRTEFGFDMVQVAKNRYTSDSYHDFIGFNVSTPVLERAFQKTYDLQLKDVIPNEDLAVGTFRRAISRLIPDMTRIALVSRRKEIVRDTPNFNEKKFLYHLSRAQYQKQWGNGYRKPGAGARTLSFLLRILPKVGPLRAASFKIPSTQSEDIYIGSINKTVDEYGAMLRSERTKQLTLTNLDFDTGKPAAVGEYTLADKTYAKLLNDMSKRGVDQVTPDLRQSILAFYATPPKTSPAKKDGKAWVVTQEELEKLKAAPAAAPIAPSR